MKKDFDIEKIIAIDDFRIDIKSIDCSEIVEELENKFENAIRIAVKDSIKDGIRNNPVYF